MKLSSTRRVTRRPEAGRYRRSFQQWYMSKLSTSRQSPTPALPRFAEHSSDALQRCEGTRGDSHIRQGLFSIMVGSGTPEKMKMSTTELRTSGQRGRNDCTIPGCLLHPLTLAHYVSPSRVGEEDQLITALAVTPARLANANEVSMQSGSAGPGSTSRELLKP